MGSIEGSTSHEETFGMRRMLTLHNHLSEMEAIAVAPKMVVHKEEKTPECADGHQQRLLAMGDAMAVLGGKWKIHLIGVLTFKGKRRFSDLLRDLDGIGPKMLSKDLQELEANQLVSRRVLNTKPITVEYEITEYGKSLTTVICEIVSWGMAHRERIMRG